MKNVHVKPVAEALGKILSDSFVLYVKTLNFHWNMKSPQFYMFHKLLQEQIEALQELNDDLAEQVRIMGFYPPSSMADFLKLTCLKEAGSAMSGDKMIKELLADHHHLSEHCSSVIKLCQEHGDEGTADLLIDRLRFHDKQAWLLESHL
jgi:starvation-inducible DNA-binding protein